MIQRCILIMILAHGIVWGNAVYAGEPTLEQAQNCTQINARLERLACFDTLFQTPTKVHLESSYRPDVPASWQRAYDSLSQYQAEDVSHLTTKGTAERGNAWVTLVALNEKTAFDDNAKPILLMSCIDNLSRVELAFPSAIDDAQVNISIVGMRSQSWRSDDIGLLFSSGRGIPAIEMMKAMAKQPRLVLRSNSRIVDGLWFDASTLSSSLVALRSRCGW
ncbi:type VI secretion-associated protein, VC_A0118 family [Vibrio ichthyoenteri ATCC 700023]|uniref:Type VI secretion-associated protein, VC_A0118 family n=1 Tax=Vibrio ichthyoenteri ATCC 700023 TaxID=870968 RepID=F9S032_9VIBR|nr:type VI secretion system-associated protein VasI [Vibrio ichthyoenteri]EGU43900.1 type VI secretion-associated protein, VC_A0118 family [Vibrio ichthyoenteri ATCC 700023]